ncbi:MAG: NAD(P) transhydrogenase subunit alpha [Chthoniobacterales bacterium]|nr:NAD(P) transhydrogenase subunit alpha [Chthoniobacterales bacterium]
MLVFFPCETGSARVALTPANAGKLQKLGLPVAVESGLGDGLGWPDEAYAEAGAKIVARRSGPPEGTGLVVRVGKPADAASSGPRGAVHISSLDPFRDKALLDELAAAGVSAISVEMIPRTTIAQKMDVLSSQASLAGYAAVILAAERLDRVLPMMMTPSGTIAAAKVFIIGAGVAGLQAIATAKRLGAKVEAFDTRPAVEEQVQSLGAKFVKIDLGETGQTEQGYAKALSEEQLARQREFMAKQVAQSDVVITTAQVFGRPAPRILTAAMLEAMRPGSVVIDMAAATGGNVEGSEPGGEKRVGGALLIGALNLADHVAVNASQMLSNNYLALIEHLWDKEAEALKIDPSDEILSGCLLTHGGRVVHPQFREKS